MTQYGSTLWQLRAVDHECSWAPHSLAPPAPPAKQRAGTSHQDSAYPQNVTDWCAKPQKSHTPRGPLLCIKKQDYVAAQHHSHTSMPMRLSPLSTHSTITHLLVKLDAEPPQMCGVAQRCATGLHGGPGKPQLLNAPGELQLQSTHASGSVACFLATLSHCAGAIDSALSFRAAEVLAHALCNCYNTKSCDTASGRRGVTAHGATLPSLATAHAAAHACRND